MIVPLDDGADRTTRPAENTTKMVSWVRHQIEVVEVDIEDGVHCVFSHAEREDDRFQMAVRGHLKYVSILMLGSL